MSKVAIALLLLLLLPSASPAEARRRRAPSKPATLWVGGERFPAPQADARRVLLIGDSNFFGPLGHTLRTSLMQRGYQVEIRGKPSSGLARPEFFDWFAEAQRLIDLFRPDLVIAMLGANDVQRLTWPQLGDRIQWSNERGWRRAYEGRYREFARMLENRVADVVLLSPTNRGWDNARAAVTRVREVQQRAVRGLAGVHWIDMFPLSSDPNGSWLHFGEARNGQRIVYRRADRIHLTKDGAKLVGTKLLATLRGLDLSVSGFR